MSTLEIKGDWNIIKGQPGSGRGTNPASDPEVLAADLPLHTLHFPLDVVMARSAHVC